MNGLCSNENKFSVLVCTVLCDLDWRKPGLHTRRTNFIIVCYYVTILTPYGPQKSTLPSKEAMRYFISIGTETKKGQS